jgi:hypothetical protein
MNTPVSVVREDAIPILVVNAWNTPSAMSRNQETQVAKNAANKAIASIRKIDSLSRSCCPNNLPAFGVVFL